MRISDWSSDVCSSDLEFSIAERADDREQSPRRPDEEQDRFASCCPGDQRRRPENSSTDDDANRKGKNVATSERRARSAQAVLQRCRRRSEEHTSELQSLMRISYAVFCLKKQNTTQQTH